MRAILDLAVVASVDPWHPQAPLQVAAAQEAHGLVVAGAALARCPRIDPNRLYHPVLVLRDRGHLDGYPAPSAASDCPLTYGR